MVVRIDTPVTDNPQYFMCPLRKSADFLTATDYALRVSVQNSSTGTPIHTIAESAAHLSSGRQKLANSVWNVVRNGGHHLQ